MLILSAAFLSSFNRTFYDIYYPVFYVVRKFFLNQYFDKKIIELSAKTWLLLSRKKETLSLHNGNFEIFRGSQPD